jgi:glycosyltransferase involved in cell wall biosynthesis
MLIIQAMNVHQGGGLSLLLALLAAQRGHEPVRALLDRRLDGTRDWPAHLQIHWVEPSVTARFRAEKWLRRTATKDDIVLCFGNLPPLWRLPSRVVVFVQNRLLVDQLELDSFGWKTRLRLLVERKWLALCKGNADRVIVQTPSMQKLAAASLGMALAEVGVCAFVPMAGAGSAIAAAAPQPGEDARGAAFLYPASGDPYKNHRVLLAAWTWLAARAIRPTLHLTVDRAIYPELVAWIEAEQRQHALAIINHGHLPPVQLAQLYQDASALIFPSRFESFGLPLLEAAAAGLPVIAAERDYVRDVVVPVHSFDPDSPVSIGRAVQRFLGLPADTVALASAAQFLATVQGDSAA